jgi:predicted RNase H-like HicB family nuclease
MQYQVFVKNQSDKHFIASVIEMPSIAVEGNTEAEAIANAKIALESQLAMGKIVTISLAEPLGVELEPKNSSTPTVQYAGILENDPTFDDWMEKLANIRQVANQIEDEI